MTPLVRLVLAGYTILLGSLAHPVYSAEKAGPIATIDQLVVQHLEENDLKPNRIASEEVFVRRAYLDLVGRIPTAEETRRFLEDENLMKRGALVRSLIGSEGYVSHQFNYWADLLRARSRIAGNNQSLPAGMAYEQWVKNAIRENRPYDEIVYDLVTSHGSSWENPAVGYYLRDYGMPLDNLAVTTQVFLGTQIVCAQCHDHPFDEWTQMDYYHLTAFTYPLLTTNSHPNQKKAMDLLEERKGKIHPDRARDLRKAFSEILFPVRFNNVIETQRKIRLPHDYQYDDAKPRSIVEPATLMGNEAVTSPAKPTVDAFGEWLTSPENPRFTKVIVNRLWKRAFGVGLIEPVDDIKEHTQPSNPELMAYLEKLMVQLDYDIQAFQRILYQTRTYQRESVLEEPIPGAPFHFQGPILRRMTAEQIWDSLVSLTVEDPDARNEGRELFAKRRLATVRLIAESIYDQTPSQFLRNGQEIAKVQQELSVEIEAAQNKVTEAREKGDPDLIREASAEAREIRQRLARIVEEKVYREGLLAKLENFEESSRAKSPRARGDEEDLAFLEDMTSAMTSSKGAMSMSSMSMQSGSNKGIVEQVVNAMLADEQRELRDKRLAQETAEKEAWAVKTRDDQKNFKNFQAIQRRMQRASDLGSPAPSGHFLREFGQSDRELVENASDEASITQALALLNGPTLGSVTHRYSVLSRSLASKSMPEKLETIYYTLLSRAPTPRERQIFAKAWQTNPEIRYAKDIVWTVLNTRQFLFIQ